MRDDDPQTTINPGPTADRPAEPNQTHSQPEEPPSQHGDSQKISARAHLNGASLDQQPRRGNPAWVKGVSGNPAGRPKGIRDLRERHARELALELLTGVDEHGKCVWMESVRARIAKGKLAPPVEVALMHYAFGRPVERVEVSGQIEARQIDEMSTDELLARAAEIVANMRAIRPGVEIPALPPPADKHEPEEK